MSRAEAAARAWSLLRLTLPWTRRAEMNKMIGLVADHYQCTPAQAFALMYSYARTPWERAVLASYKPEGNP